MIAGDKEEEDDANENFPYKPFEREFYFGRWWVWLIQALSYIGIGYFYFTIEGKELAYAVYIPLDFAIFIAMSAFWTYYYYQDKRKKRLDEELKQMIEEKLKTNLAANIMRRFSEVDAGF